MQKFTKKISKISESKKCKINPRKVSEILTKNTVISMSTKSAKPAKKKLFKKQAD